MNFYKTRQIAVVFVSLLLAVICSCSFEISPVRKATVNLELSVPGTLAAPARDGTGSRFLTASSRPVKVTAYRGSASGEVLASTTFAVQAASGNPLVVTAKGSLELPIATPLVIKAEAESALQPALQPDPDNPPIAVALSASSEQIVIMNDVSTINLFLLPVDKNILILANEPGGSYDDTYWKGLKSLAPGVLNALKFKVNGNEAKISFYGEDINYQIRSPSGSIVVPSVATETGLSKMLTFPVTANQEYYLLLNYSGDRPGGTATNLEIEAVQPPMLIANAVGQVLYSTNRAYTWSNAIETGLSALKDLIYANGYFIAIGSIDTGTDVLAALAYSKDGRSWERYPLPAESGVQWTFSFIGVNPAGQVMAIDYKVIPPSGAASNTYSIDAYEVSITGSNVSARSRSHVFSVEEQMYPPEPGGLAWLSTSSTGGYWIASIFDNVPNTYFRKQTETVWDEKASTDVSCNTLCSVGNKALASFVFGNDVRVKLLDNDDDLEEIQVNIAGVLTNPDNLHFAVTPGASPRVLLCGREDIVAAKGFSFLSTDQGATWGTNGPFVNPVTAARGYSGGFFVATRDTLSSPELFISADGTTFTTRGSAPGGLGSVDIVAIAVKE